MRKSLQRDRKSYLSALCRAIPYHIVEAVLANPVERALAARSHDGSVLVIDLVGFTPMCEKLAARGATGLSELHELLDQFFEWLELDAVFPYGGYIVQFAGDAVMVVFHGEEHARRCTACALTIERLLKSPEKDEVLGKQGGELVVRMGIALGRIQLHVLGDFTRTLSMCGGTAPHEAIRLQQRAEPGEILADVALGDELGADLAYRERDSHALVPQDLANWPEREPVPALDDRLAPATDEKISLLEPFVPQPLAKRMRSTLKGWRLQGEIRRPVILFVDFQGFDERHENMDLARDVARSVLRAFRKYDGVVLNVAATAEGHRALLVYGLQNPSENDAERCLLSALEATGRVMALSMPSGMTLTTRMGIHAGDVYLGSIGSSYKHDLTAIGDAVNVAARVAMSASPFEVVSTDDALAGVADEFRLTERSTIRVKGKSEPVGVCVVHGPTDGRSHYVQLRRLERFFAGRERAIDELNRIVKDALGGEAQIVGIAGEAGTGKSALLSRVIDAWLEGGGIGIVGRCRFATRTSPLAPIVDMLSTYFGFTESDDDAHRAELIRAGLADIDLKEGLQELLTLLQPVRRPDGLVEALVDLADGQTQDRVLDAVVQFVRQRVQKQKLLYVLEDIHLADTLTLQMIRRMASLDRNNAYLFIATYRPEEFLSGVRGELDEEVGVGNLNQPAAEKLICHELGARRIDEALSGFLWRRTEGNPEHLVQILRFLSDRFLIKVRNDKAEAAEPGVPMLEDVVPRSWAHVALARLEGLGEVERQILRAASAIGRQFHADVLRQASGLDLEPELLDTAVSILESEQVITPERDRELGPQYRFRDDVTRAIAYSMIPETERKVLHRRIADALEKQGQPSSQAFAAAMAHHRERAEQWKPSAQWYERVAHMAAQAGMDREACYFADRWSAVVRRLPRDQRPPRARAARVNMARLVATARQGLPRSAFAQARRMIQLHRPDLDVRSSSLLDFILAEAHFYLGRPDDALERLRKVQDAPTCPERLRFGAACLIARIHLLRWQFEACEKWLDKAERLAGRDDTRRIRLDLLWGERFLDGGDLDESRRLFEVAEGKASGQGRVALRAWCSRCLARQALLADDLDRAECEVGQALKYDRRAGNLRGEASDLSWLGLVLLRMRRPDEARPHLEMASGIARELGNELLRAAIVAHLGAAVALADDPAEGLRLFREGKALAIRYGLKNLEREADIHQIHLGKALGNRDLFEEGLQRYHRHPGERSSPLHHRLITESLMDDSEQTLITRPRSGDAD